MNKVARNIAILILPYLIVMIVNESIRFNKKKPFKSIKETITINSDEALLEECTWHCFNSATYCVKTHTKVFTPIVPYLNPFYFGIVSSLKSTGNYVVANIIYLITLWPLIMYILLLKVLNNHQKLKSIK